MDDVFTVDLAELLSNGDSMDPVTYQYYKSLKDNTIVINEGICEDILEKAVLPLMQMDKDESVKHIDIYLNTEGGSVYDGFLLVDVIDKIKTDTTITIMGMAASMGIYIAMAGHNNPNVKTVCYSHSVGLIHDGSYYINGSMHSARDTFKFSERYEQKIKDYVLSHSAIDEDTYRDFDRVEAWMTAEDMVEYGIVDEIL